jgi:hypothetical protein
MPTFLANQLHPRLRGYRSNEGRGRSGRSWIWDEDSDYRGYYSGDEYYSTENEVDKVAYAGKNVPGQDGS